MEQLETMTSAYPYFAVPHFLLLKKMLATDHAGFTRQLHLTNLYFHNPLWLQYLLIPVGGETSEHTPEIRTHEEAASEPVPGLNIEDDTTNAETADRSPGNNQAWNDDPAEEQSRDNEDNATPGGPDAAPVEQHPTGDRQHETAVEPVTTTASFPDKIQPTSFGGGQGMMDVVAAMFEKESFPPDQPAEAERSPSRESETHTEDEQPPTHIPAASSSPNADDDNAFQSVPEKPGPETGPAEIKELTRSADLADPADQPDHHPIQKDRQEPTAGITQTAGSAAPADPSREAEINPLPLPMGEGGDKKADLLFEPYHTVDYFASQGIKLSRIEGDPRDKLGRQLKSFTEWLKTMKRLPNLSVDHTLPASEEQQLVEAADQSLVSKTIVTEAMAEVLVKQGLIAEAQHVYHKLSLLNPAKTAYFAKKSEDLKTD